MEARIKKKLATAGIVYWFLLAYIIAMLVWWFIALENQNHQMAMYKLSELKKDDPSFERSYEMISAEKKRKTARNIGEGSTFLALTLAASVFVYRAVRRQIKLQHQQENFMMAVTHELKTPIAIARLNLETLLKHQLDETKKQKLLMSTLQETDRLNKLASNILVSSQLEGGRYRFSKEELDFSELVKTAVNDFNNRFPERHWQTGIEPEIDILGDSLLLQILVNNLLENAIKYAPKGGLLECRLYRKHHTILFQVVDEGPGIPDDEKKEVFEKFYRIGNETTRTTQGTGLGLYLCKKIVEDHGGSIRITDNIKGGSNFTVSLPSKSRPHE